MPSKKVIQLGGYRELLSQWELVREEIVAGHIKGLHTTMLLSDQQEVVLSAGVYRRDPQRAISAILNASADRMLSEDEPLHLQVESA